MRAVPTGGGARTVTIEGSPAVRDRNRTAAVVPPSRFEVILVSSGLRCPLRGRYRMSVSRT